jgi:rubrerythrin
MAKVSPDNEVLKFAIARELEAYHFYMALAGRVSTIQMREVFVDLAREELEHKARLELEVIKMGNVVGADEKAVIGKHDYIISDVDSPLHMDYKEMLLLGMEKEEASSGLMLISSPMFRMSSREKCCWPWRRKK